MKMWTVNLPLEGTTQNLVVFFDDVQTLQIENHDIIRMINFELLQKS